MNNEDLDHLANCYTIILLEKVKRLNEDNFTRELHRAILECLKLDPATEFTGAQKMLLALFDRTNKEK